MIVITNLYLIFGLHLYHTFWIELERTWTRFLETLSKLKTENEWEKELPFLSLKTQHMLCKVYTKLNDKITCKSYNANFIKGCANLRKPLC